VLTCTAGQSRNHALGVALGRGESLDAALAARQPSIVEGVATASAVARLTARLGIDMPITSAVDGVLHRGIAIDAMIDGLLSRPWRSE
jgi:glycerol-3-phosphate dehydrogenase (NAD(P)+)